MAPASANPQWRPAGPALQIGLAALLLSACAQSSSTPGGQPGEQTSGPAQGRPLPGVVDPYREFIVIGTTATFDVARLPENWYAAVDGNGALKIATAEKDGVLALHLTGDGNASIVGRRVQMPLLNMPYLRWGWYLEPAAAKPAKAETGSGASPVLLRVVVGFRDGPAAESATGNDAPKVDRALSLEWRPAPANQTEDHDGSFAIRAGYRDQGKWLIEAVDLSRFYERAWPQAAMDKAEIAFVAVGAGPTPQPAAGYVAEVVLSP